MEKYGKWTDGATGINPFVPRVNSTPLWWYIIFTPVFLIRFLLLVIMFFTSSFFTILFAFIPVKIVRRFLERYYSALYCFVLMKVMGVFYVKEVNYVSKKDKKSCGVLGKISSFFKRTQNVHLIIANFNSYLQVLYLGMKYSPIFVTCVSSDITDGVKVVCHQNWLLFLFRMFVNSRFDYKKDGMNLDELVKLVNDDSFRSKPIVLFPEGVSSNGRGVLKFQRRIFAKFKRVERYLHKIDVIGFKFDDSRSWFSPSYHVNSSFMYHFVNLLYQPFAKMEVCHLVDPLYFKKSCADQVDGSRKKIKKMLNVELLDSCGMAEKKTFMKYWKKTHKGGYIS